MRRRSRRRRVGGNKTEKRQSLEKFMSLATEFLIKLRGIKYGQAWSNTICCRQGRFQHTVEGGKILSLYSLLPALFLSLSFLLSFSLCFSSTQTFSLSCNSPLLITHSLNKFYCLLNFPLEKMD